MKTSFLCKPLISLLLSTEIMLIHDPILRIKLKPTVSKQKIVVNLHVQVCIKELHYFYLAMRAFKMPEPYFFKDTKIFANTTIIFVNTIHTY